MARPVQEAFAPMLLEMGTELVQGVGVHTGHFPVREELAWQLQDCTDPVRL